MTTLVWFKRDLRLQDHAPLNVAADLALPTLALYVIEPEWLASPEFDAQHLAFVWSCLRDLRGRLAAKGLPLTVRVGTMMSVLGELHNAYGFKHLLSHEETGPGWTYARDLAVAAWCRRSGVAWQEFPQTGVVRRLPTRNGWAARWQKRMNADQVPSPTGWRGVALHGNHADMPTLRQILGAPIHALSSIAGPSQNDLTPAGALMHSGRSGAGSNPRARAALIKSPEAEGHAELHSFLTVRGRNYRKTISSPLKAETGCSRLSVHLAFGTLSMRTVHQATEVRIAQFKNSGDPADRAFAHALRGFAGRLRWHCHFMQKLEDEPRIEAHNFSSLCNGLREGDFNRAHFDAWCRGQTGYPMVDACMRSLVQTGWLNFRMRAMLVSFAAYHLWLHWCEPGLFLARQFLDFEAGIHWSQMQMQSGTTGINTLRMYSPTKQALDHDPEGIFIRRWVPELQNVPLSLLATPWLMGADQQEASGCVLDHDYPRPIVDDKTAVKQAKDKLYALRQTPQAKAQAQAIQEQHGSRKSGLPVTDSKCKAGKKPVAKRGKKAAASTLQMSLFEEGEIQTNG